MPVTSRLKKKHNQLLAIVLTGKPHGNSTFVVHAISRASAIFAKNKPRGMLEIHEKFLSSLCGSRATGADRQDQATRPAFTLVIFTKDTNTQRINGVSLLYK